MLEGRFSKANVALALYRKYIRLCNKHNFSAQNGYAQVEGKKTATIVAYGEWNMCKELLSEMDAWELIPDSEPGLTVPMHAGHPRLVRD